MQTYKSIEKALREKDVDTLRQSVADIIYIDRNFSGTEFEEVLRYINSKINIMDSKLTGKLISEEKTTYTQDDFVNAIFELKNNFCNERIEDVKKIGKSLYPIQNKTKYTGAPSKKDPSYRTSLIPVAVIFMAIIAAVSIIIGIIKK